MKVLIVHQAYMSPADPGGTRHHELAKHLVSSGHSVAVVASDVSYLTGARTAGSGTDGVEVRRARTFRGGRSFASRLLSFATFMLSSVAVGLRTRRVDVVWGTSPPIFQGVSAWLVARLKRRPFVLEIRDLWPDFAVATGVLRDARLIGASRWLERRLLRAADLVIVNSPGFVDHVRARGVPPTRVAIIPNGVDLAGFSESIEGRSYRKEHGLADAFVVLYAGAHGLANDLGQVLDAAERVSDPRIRFVLVGDGKEKTALVEEARRRGLSNVVFLPPVPKTRMPEVLAAADACLATLKAVPEFATVYPNKVFDYMAARRPVILAIPGVIRDVLLGAQAGIAVAPGDGDAIARAAEKYARDPALARAHGRNGRACVEKDFDRRAHAAELERQLARIIGGKR